jgi:serine/threonine protein kinase
MPMATRINLVRKLVPWDNPCNLPFCSTRQWKGVIEGVVYLHDQNPPIVHGDLKPVS